jgi:two-component SAPR family response regulator
LSTLAAKKVLVVEDDFLIAVMVKDMLLDDDACVVGPANTLDAGLALANTADVDAALLDINLRGERSDAIAAQLQRRGIPFVLTTGYGEALTDRFAAPVLTKPFTREQLLEALARLLQVV